jgi:hypothetical protein
MYIKLLFLFLLFFVSFSTSYAQVLIGDTTGGTDPKAILQLKDTTRGFLLPKMTSTQMNAIGTPTDGLLVYNSSVKTIYQYKQSNGLWMPIRSDSSDWYLDTISKKLYLKYGLANEDSIYYHTLKKKFLYTDTRFYTTSSGFKFNLDEGNSDKYIFKVTASKFPRDPTNLNSANVYSVFEVDNDTIATNYPFESNYYGLNATATVTPTALQKIGQISGLQAATAFGGKDSINFISGFSNTALTRGKGNVDVLQGINNTVSVRDSTTKIGEVTGIQTFLSYSSPLSTARVGFLAGFRLNMSSAYANKVDGPAYGLLMGNVNASATASNFAIYTSKGVNHLGDSTLITDGNFAKPRAVLDVNTSSAMILPTGTTAQRPVNLFTGMLRYNIDNATPEAYTGTAWVQLKSPVLSNTLSIDPPAVGANTTATISITATGAAVGNTVTIAPTSTLPAGFFIAWARVSAANTIEIAFGNMTGTVVDVAAQNFYIKIVQ